MKMFDIFFNHDHMLKRLKADYPISKYWITYGKGVWNKIEYKYDFTHANSKGYRIMAENIFNEMKELLEYNNLVK
jgi:lysophospholipase L1-like esterase